MFNNILKNIENNTPIVHCITNYVTVNDCANIILASGGSPIMADDVSEAADITSICQSLVINIGTLNEKTIPSMILAGKKANELGHPVILDPVGVGASPFRNETVKNLLNEVKFAVIRGNISEIKFISTGFATTKGVDASDSDISGYDDNIDGVIDLAKSLSKKTGAVIAITGAVDVVTDSEKSYVVTNGHKMMSKVTGTGCMLSAVIGCYVGANYKNVLDSTASAVCAMGLCGELAYEKLCRNDSGTNSYRMFIIDFMSKLDCKTLKEGAKIEIR